MNERCPHCGSVPRSVWHRDAILAAIRAWAQENGAAPSQSDWRHPDPFTPSISVVQDVFGSWNQAIKEAGFTPRPHGGQGARAWTRAEATDALFRWVYTHSRLPTSKEWQTPGGAERPSRMQIVTLFGTWNAFIVYAGYEPRRPLRSERSYLNIAAARATGPDWRERRVANLEGRAEYVAALVEGEA